MPKSTNKITEIILPRDVVAALDCIDGHQRPKTIKKVPPDTLYPQLYNGPWHTIARFSCGPYLENGSFSVAVRKYRSGYLYVASLDGPNDDVTPKDILEGEWYVDCDYEVLESPSILTLNELLAFVATVGESPFYLLGRHYSDWHEYNGLPLGSHTSLHYPDLPQFMMLLETLAAHTLPFDEKAEYEWSTVVDACISILRNQNNPSKPGVKSAKKIAAATVGPFSIHPHWAQNMEPARVEGGIAATLVRDDGLSAVVKGNYKLEKVRLPKKAITTTILEYADIPRPVLTTVDGQRCLWPPMPAVGAQAPIMSWSHIRQLATIAARSGHSVAAFLARLDARLTAEPPAAKQTKVQALRGSITVCAADVVTFAIVVQERSATEVEVVVDIVRGYIIPSDNANSRRFTFAAAKEITVKELLKILEEALPEDLTPMWVLWQLRYDNKPSWLRASFDIFRNGAVYCPVVVRGEAFDALREFYTAHSTWLFEYHKSLASIPPESRAAINREIVEMVK